MGAEGRDECAWPGVTCRGLGVHAALDEVAAACEEIGFDSHPDDVDAIFDEVDADGSGRSP